ncbi:HNH endonuclease signature motif containing protein [Rhodococcus sp. UNC363MFTsu5.1]|uniref:HNH endonuclease signature motif containing protein n=1 Tax=Rhodococcus sp. UNC363MFTsu5.1 TaxID=1449069 RepID=UPI00068A3458|nr:HNH endonuclease signature motif containing protein [Rhodococcus sp. UNC363MFTsu5.1]
MDFENGTDALAALQGYARAENIAAARKVLTSAAFARRQFASEVDLFGEEFAYRAGRSAEMETALALGVSAVTAERYVAVGNALDLRMPLIRAVFVSGRADFPRVFAIVDAVAEISDATLALMEPHLADVALYLTPRKLVAEVMRELIRINPAEAEELRKRRERHSRRVSVTADLHGMAQVYATLTAAEGRTLDSLIREMAGTVCREDPRTVDNLRTDAFMALVHGETYLHCQCGRDACPTVHLPRPERPKPEVHIHIDLDTLLRLADNPSHLEGHGPIDPELARLLAGDATWQAVIADARRLDAQRSAAVGDEPDGEGRTDIVVDCEGDSACDAKVDCDIRGDNGSDGYFGTGPGNGVDPEGLIETGRDGAGGGVVGEGGAEPPRDRRDVQALRDGLAGADPADCVNCDPTRELKGDIGLGNSSAPTSPPGVPARYRLRCRQAGHLPPRHDPPAQRSQPPDDHTRGPRVTDILDAIAANPALLNGQYPDGHGGYDHPPRGALTYRPSNTVRGAVFDKYDTCTFPGCTVKARDCQFDHIVEFDPDNPDAGGWSVESNGEPACTRHHQAKTDRLFRVVRLEGDVIVWIGAHGTIGVTLPLPAEQRTSVQAKKPASRPTPQPRSPAPPPTEPPDLGIYEPTWWETHMHPGDLPPTLADLATITDPGHLALCAQLRIHHAEHQAILGERHRHQPPPF